MDDNKNKNKTDTELLEDVLFIQWRKREKFIVTCKRLGFDVWHLILISSQYYSYKCN
jgi:hypothetical protein